MKKVVFTWCLASCLIFCGCQALTNAFAPRGEATEANRWDGTDYKRSVGVGTGIDPQAREIEQRLGYAN